MDPSPFVRLTVSNLALKIPVASKPARSVIHPSSSPCFCKIKLKNHRVQTSPVPPQFPDGQVQVPAATFHLTGKSLLGQNLFLRISLYTGRRGATCGVDSGRLLGKVAVPIDLTGTEIRGSVFHNGWVSVGKDSKNGDSRFHLTVKAEPDPRFVFQFDGEPECSPLVFQVKGSIRQPVFTCKFSFRSNIDRNHRSRSFPSESSSNSRTWLSSFGSERERPVKERKGWSITVHDLSGSPVAAASMVTPFVASPAGSDRVSRSNPGSWLILRPGDGTWKPWGRLEAWRERGSSDGLGYRFELIPPDSAAAGGIVVAESTLSSSKGGKFVIDRVDFGYGGVWPYCVYGGGFVMGVKVEGEGKKGSKPTVEVSVQQVTCAEDAAAYVALAAAVDLSMDACKVFSKKLRKELCAPRDHLFL